MAGVERWLKGSSLVPLRIAGEIIFGTHGEAWEEARRAQNG